MNISYCGGLQILYGNNSIINYIIFGVSILCIAVTFIAFLYMDKHHYGEFYYLLKPELQAQLYFSFNMIYRFLLGGIFSLFHESAYGVVYALCLSICFLIYQLSTRPFKLGYHNYRSTIFLLSIVIILGIRSFYRSLKNNYPVI